MVDRTKADVVDFIARNSRLSKTESERALNSFIEYVEAQVADGDKVKLVGFGTFKRAHRNARVGRNPRSGESIDIPARDVPVFKAGKIFKEQVK